MLWRDIEKRPLNWDEEGTMGLAIKINSIHLRVILLFLIGWEFHDKGVRIIDSRVWKNSFAHISENITLFWRCVWVGIWRWVADGKRRVCCASGAGNADARVEFVRTFGRESNNDRASASSPACFAALRPFWEQLRARNARSFTAPAAQKAFGEKTQPLP